MAFLDNSGDIILDAVLTDVGRKRMAQGNFKITKYAMGDDEIDYGTYNVSHPSGSAYADLEILQTPILEAFTQVNATINYGLVSYSRNDLLYLPTIAINTKMTDDVVFAGDQNVIYLADDSKYDTDNVITGDLLMASTRAGPSTVLRTTQTSTRYILVETGINTSDIPPTSANQGTYILNVGLHDRQYMVGFDSRFIAGVLGASSNSTFTNDSTSQQGAVLSVSLQTSRGAQAARSISNFTESPVNGVVSTLYKPSSGPDNTGNKSNIAGPRGTFTALNFAIHPGLGDADYTRYGKTSQNIFADGKNFDYIDTIVYVKGLTTNVTIQIPIRVTRVTS